MKKQHRIHKYFFLLTICILLLSFLPGTTVVTAQTGATTYYVDATGGNNSNDGTSPSSAWQSIFKVKTPSVILYLQIFLPG